ncbi:hypothetical protein FO470_08085 [Starkeya sp. 3C]|uniref:Uncharacterized protein n=1 Tax=Ancylobacter moscoviensis TaxID=2597768 RepID=A0ABY3DSL4_9HYPH|nr:hypothetical protein [Ancylobacter moscoviensis]TSJ62942.1 hypothetical protein FO470_08085 [Ancylobacter moscoviensis]
MALAMLTAGLVALPPVAWAQAGLSDLPVPDVDPRMDPAPFDGRRAIRDYLKAVLPTRWWANEPEFSLGAFSVMIHVPDNWQGNPTSAVMRLCPPAYSVLWSRLDRIEFVPFYRDARRAGITCRKG